jgi:DNA-binding CsgD family transcriptional regulator
MRENSKLRTAVLDTLWKSTLVGLAVFDGAQGTLREANGAFLDLLDSRYRTKKTLGSSLEQCLPEVEAGGLQAAFRQCLSSGLAVHVDAVRFHRHGGSSLLVNCILMPLLDEHGEGAAETGLPPVLLVASERKTELPAGDRLNLVDIHTRQALARHFHLSAREIDIVGECLQGKKNRQIAQDLHIGISTVKRHLESAYRKMGISSSRSLPIAILNVLRTLEPAAATAGASAELSLAVAPQAGSQAA